MLSEKTPWIVERRHIETDPALPLAKSESYPDKGSG